MLLILAITLAIHQAGPTTFRIDFAASAPVQSFGVCVIASAPIAAAYREDGLRNVASTSTRWDTFTRYIIVGELSERPEAGNLATLELAWPGVVQWDTAGTWAPLYDGRDPLEWGAHAAGLEVADGYHGPWHRAFTVDGAGTATDLPVTLESDYHGHGCPGDWDGDGRITLADLAILLGGFGREYGMMDLSVTLGLWGQACPLGRW